MGFALSTEPFVDVFEWRRDVSNKPVRYLILVLMVTVGLVMAACPAPAPTLTLTPTPAATPKPTVTPSPTATPPPSPMPTLPPSIVTEAVNIPGQAVPIKAYEARPAGVGPFPALIVIHENRALTDHIRDVARRFAAQGYAALAPDLLSRVGGREQFPTDTEAVAAINALTPDGVREDLQSTFDYLKGRSYVKPDRIGVIGYCWGGGNSLLMGTRVPELRVVVVYYGPNPSNIDDVANITGPVLGIYGELDTRISMNVPALVDAMKKHNKSFAYEIYPGAAHAFFNDTGANYNQQAADEAWKVTLAFLEKNLKS